MRNRVIVLSIALLFAFAMATPLFSLPSGSSGYSITYYSDDTFTDVVGGRFMECNGYPDSWGERTQYYEYASWGCQSGDPGYSCSQWVCYANPYEVTCANVGACSNNRP